VAGFNFPIRTPFSLWAKLVCSGLLLLGPLHGQNVPTFRTGVFIVHVDVEVLGQDNRPIMDLDKDDFRVFDGGREQVVTALSRGEQPLDLILLFDTSGSMRRQLQKVWRVADLALRELHPGDRVAVVVFNSQSQIISPFTSELDAVQQAIREMLSLGFGGRTKIQAAVRDAANYFGASGPSDNAQRRAILVVSDDLGIPDRHKNAILSALWEADCLVSGLITPNRAALKERLHATRSGGVEDFVEQTGGDMIRSDDLSTSFPEMMRRIRNRYTLYYKLPDGKVGELQKIDVQLSPRGCERYPGAHVLSRRGYRLRPRDQYGFASH
jgi:VWFA-related protein